MTQTRTKLLIPRSEILDLGDYERQRDDIRPSAIAARKIRRVAFGPDATLSFENRETLTYQVHEMLRAERIAKEPEVAHEIETYSELLPASSELSATLMIAIDDPGERALRLEEMLGLDKHLKIEFEGAGSACAEFDQRQIDEERLSSVQFVRFELTSDQSESLLSGRTVRIICDHPAYPHSVTLPMEVTAALASDLRDATEMEAAADV